MSDPLTVSIDTSKAVANPTLEEEAAKLDAAALLPPKTDDRPEWFNEKFKTVEDQAKAYNELEKKLGAKPKADDEVDPAVAAAAAADAEADAAAAALIPDSEDVKAAKALTTAAGLDFDALSASYAKNGKLDDAEYAALAKAGHPKALVDSFIKGQQALATADEGRVEATRQSVFTTVGGEQNYAAMVEWAGENFTEAEITVFNNSVNGVDTNATMFAVKALKAQYEAAEGFEPTTPLRGNQTPGPSQAAYRSLAEMEKDMNDPRYQTDPAWRADVARKLDASDIM